MQNTRKRLLFPTLAGLTLCVTLTARMTSAQGPGDQQGQGGPGQGGFGGGRRQNGQNGQGQNGRGGFGGQMPFATGTVTGGDANMRTITIQSQFGGAQTIQLGTTTQLVTQLEVSVADLQVGDQVQVQGVPTGISASSLTVGQMPTFMQGGRGGPGGGQGGPGGQNNNGQNNGGQNDGGGVTQAANSRTAFASATGRIMSVSPLTISLGNDVSITVKMAAKARVTKISQLAFSGLKVGDRVMAAGQANANGSFQATGIGVNMIMGGPGGMGMGGPGGGRGGFGGPGGPPMPGGE